MRFCIDVRTVRVLLPFASCRLQVFQIEQGFESEFDDLDQDSAIHFIAEIPADTARQFDPALTGCDPVAVAAGRIYQVMYRPDSNKPDAPTYPMEMVFSIGRVCCLKAFRGQGLGQLILRKMTDSAKRLGANRLILHSQVDKVAFYQKDGFSVIQHDGRDWQFDEDGQPHVGMQLSLDTL